MSNQAETKIPVTELQAGMARAARAYGVLTFNDQFLTKYCTPIIKGEDLSRIKQMRTAMRALNGIGFAAPQIGWMRRVIIIAVPKKPMYVMFNPTIIRQSVETIARPEGCLSYPGILTDNIERPRTITVLYEDVDFRMKSVILHEHEARVGCHEIDHCNGKCVVHDHWVKQWKDRV